MKIYSTSKVTVALKRTHAPKLNASDSKNTNLSYSPQVTPNQVQLTVLNRIVGTDGFHVLINFTVTLMDEFGEYDLLVNNSIGTATQVVEIVSEGVYLGSIMSVVQERSTLN